MQEIISGECSWVNPKEPQYKLKDRNETIDILRGLGIVIMIMGHIGIGYEPEDYYFSVWYHAFHMPLFYLISGFFYFSSDSNAFVAKKAKSLIFPYFGWGVIHLFLNFTENCSWEDICDGIYHTLIMHPTSGDIQFAGALWFLPALFWSNIIYYYLDKWFKRVWLVTVISMCVGIVGMLAYRKGLILPMGLDTALVGALFIGAGRLLSMLYAHNRFKLLFSIKWYVLIALLCLATISIFLNGEVNFRTGLYNNYLLTIFNAIFMTIILWNIAGYIENGRIKFAKNTITSIGRNSMIYLCLNQRIIGIFLPIMLQAVRKSMLVELVLRMITLIEVIFICHVIGKLHSKTKARWLV